MNNQMKIIEIHEVFGVPPVNRSDEEFIITPTGKVYLTDLEDYFDEQ